MSRGLINNNPGNIKINYDLSGKEITNDLFKNEIRPSSDIPFRQFKSMVYGYRAMFKILFTYNKNGYDTISKAINRWAPPGENPTLSYVISVSESAGINENTKINRHSKEQMTAIVRAMSAFENGAQADVQDVDKGWDMATKGILNIIEEKKRVFQSVWASFLSLF